MKPLNTSFQRLTNRIAWRVVLTVFIMARILTLPAEAKTEEKRPNILWIIPDDMSAHFSCYGEKLIETPHVDRLAERGTLFENAFVTAPVCSTCRSALITGLYQTTLGAHHHRSGRGVEKISLPEEVTPLPRLFQKAGYYTTLSGWPMRSNKLGKTDYNFEWDSSMYDGSDWSQRKPGQPFFAQIHTQGGKLRGKDAMGWEKVSGAAEKTLGSRTSPDAVTLPPYYPNHPDIRRDWAAYLDAVRMTDHMVGEVMERLRQESLLDSTLIIFMTDHGISHARGKQFLYDEGLHVPLILSGPGIAPGVRREDLVEHIDLAAISLQAAGIPLPANMQGRPVMDPTYTPRQWAFGARDRCDETVDHIRSVRSQRFKYIRNFLPQRPYLQPSAYKDAKAILMAIRQWHAQGRLNPTQGLLMRATRPAEELYDLANDPHEIHNLAAQTAFHSTLVQMREALNHWMTETRDQGREPESAAMYESDMAVYLQKHRDKGDLERLKILQQNIQWMQEQAAREQ